MRRAFSGAAAIMVAAALCVSSVSRAEEPATGSTKSATDEPGGIHDISAHTRRQMISLWAFLPWYYGFGIGLGARYTIPILNDGFIDSINDSVELEFGGDVSFASYGYVGFSYSFVDVDIPVEARWTFHITPKFDVYPKIGLGVRLFFVSANNFLGTPFGGSAVGFYYDVGGGLLFHFTDSIALRAELGVTGLKAGIGFDL